MSATYAEPTTATTDRGFEEIESPMAHLSPEQLDELGRELDALHAEIFADLGERDSRYIRSTIKLHRHLVLAARALLLGSSRASASKTRSSSSCIFWRARCGRSRRNASTCSSSASHRRRKASAARSGCASSFS